MFTFSFIVHTFVSMTAKEFSNLEINRQVYLLISKGQYLDERYVDTDIDVDDEREIIKIYSLDDFYIEAWCDLENDTVLKIEVVEAQYVMENYKNILTRALTPKKRR